MGVKIRRGFSGLRFLYEFLEFLWKGVVVLLSGFSISLVQRTVTHGRNCRRLREFEEIEFSRQSCTVERTLNSKEENFCLDFVRPRIRLSSSSSKCFPF